MKRNRPLNQEKREAIIKAAIEEFYRNGYEGSSMDNISCAANVSKATVYNHFKNKEDLFLVIARILQKRFEESFSYTYQVDKPLEEQLRDIAVQEMDFLSNDENIKLIQTGTIVIIKKNAIGLKLLEIMQDSCMIMTSKWFEDAKKDKRLSFEDAQFASQQFIGMLKSFAFYPQLYGAPKLTKEECEKVIDETVRMIMKMYST